MQKYRVFILEDTKEIRESLVLDLTSFSNVEIAATASSFKEVEDIFATLDTPFDISILDIRIGIQRCFDLFNIYDRNIFGIIYFISAFDEKPDKVMQIKLANTTFLEKPLGRSSWAQILSSLKSHVQTIGRIENKTRNNYIPTRTGELRLIRDENIVAIETDDRRYTKFHCINTTYNDPYTIKSKLTLSEIEKKMSFEFLRVHKSYIINSKYLLNFGKLEGKTGSVNLEYPTESSIHYSKLYLDRLNNS